MHFFVVVFYSSSTTFVYRFWTFIELYIFADFYDDEVINRQKISIFDTCFSSLPIKSTKLGWEVLLYQPADLVPSNYHLFGSFSNSLRGVTFINNVKLEKMVQLILPVKTRWFLLSMYWQSTGTLRSREQKENILLTDFLKVLMDDRIKINADKMNEFIWQPIRYMYVILTKNRTSRR